MEESELLKERLQAITEKHRIQEDIRQKKVELDQEKLKLQHLKKKALREQWLLQDSASQNATRHQSLLSDQHQTRVLQLSIHRIEKEVESLEREESMISTKESFILNRLKVVEKSSEDIIKEAQDSFVPEPLKVTTVIPDVPESPSPPSSQPSEPDTSRKTLFAMEINVTKNMLTGESTILSTATVPPEEINQHAGLKVYDDGRKCVYALNPQEGSRDQSCVSELSATEVQQLLRHATVHRQENHQSHQNHSRREEHCFYNHQDERDRVEGCDLRQRGGHRGNLLLRTSITERDCRENWARKPGLEHGHGHQDSHNRRQEERNNQSNLREGHRLGNYRGLGHHHGNQRDRHYGSYQVINCVQDDRSASRHINGIIRSSSMVNGGRANGCPPPRSQDQEVVSSRQPQLCYTPSNYIPLRDYVSVGEEELYYVGPPSYYSHDGHPPTTQYSGSTHSDRVPSPLYGDDSAYTILNAVDATEPITAIFMGFQTAQDDSGRGQEFEGSLKAELVIIEDNEENADDSSVKDKQSSVQQGGHSLPAVKSANGNMGGVEGGGGRRTERPLGPGSDSVS